MQKRRRGDERPDACGDDFLKGAVLAAKSDLRETEAGRKRGQPDLFFTALLILARPQDIIHKESRYAFSRKRDIAALKKEKTNRRYPDCVVISAQP